MTIAFSKTGLAIFLWPAISFIAGCTSPSKTNKEMISLLQTITAAENDHRNTLSLEGKQCNRAAIGARIKVVFTDNGVQKGSFPQCKFRVFKNIPANAIINIIQGEPAFTITRLKKFN